MSNEEIAIALATNKILFGLNKEQIVFIADQIKFRLDKKDQDFSFCVREVNHLTYEIKSLKQEILEYKSFQNFHNPLVEELKDKITKLRNACLYAFQWHCGTSSEEAEKDCMDVLEEALEKTK